MAERDEVERGRRARFRRWQDATFYPDPRPVIWARRYAMVLAIALASLVVGAAFIVYRRGDSAWAALALPVVAAAVPLLFAAWRYAAFALIGPPPAGPPRLPAEFRLCPVCGSILRVQRLADGWAAVCPACTFRLPLTD
jgi:hypothetical protein